MKKDILTIIGTYILFILISFSIYKFGEIEKYKIYLVLGLNFLLIKDILINFYENKKIEKTKTDIKKLFIDYGKKNISFKYLTFFLNRNYFFPIILIIYLISLLIGQTHIFGLDKIVLFKIINQNLLLGITIFSGILTVFNEKQDKNYQIIIKTIKEAQFNIILTIFLSLLGTYIILIQTVKLGFLSYAISIISGILIFLVGISILEEEENLEYN